MGFNTTVVIRNDYLYDIAKDQEFGENLKNAVLRLTVGKPVEVLGGGAIVIETHHADYFQPLLVGKNWGYAVEGTYIDGYHADKELQLLKQLAHKHGFVLRKKPAPKGAK